MDGKTTLPQPASPDESQKLSAAIAVEAREAFESIVQFCSTSETAFRGFEQSLLTQLLALGAVLMRLFLACRNERLDPTPPAGYRPGNKVDKRTLKTLFGKIVYLRTYMICIAGGTGFYPLDSVLGLTRDRFSPWVISYVTRLATRMSFASARRLCQSVLGWSPSVDSIEQLTLGLGRQAAPFMNQLAAPEGDGEVLVIEVDGKCPPTATEEELRKRRGKRSKHPKACACGCQRHRGQAKRKRRGSKKRRKKGDKSKNGKEVVVVVMYTLSRGADGRLHGPKNKKVWASFGDRKGAARWARAEATKRGFGPKTTKTVQIVFDGASGLRNNLAVEFPRAILTIDVWHVVEYLWELGHCFHPEGSDELKALVEDWKELLYAGRASELVERWERLLDGIPMTGPGTSRKRKGLAKAIGYVKRRVTLMKYREWRDQDLVLGSGQVEGAVRHLVGERLDCAGMRWIRGRAQAVLQLRCIELNGDWDNFIAWSDQQNQRRLQAYEVVRVSSDQPLVCGFSLAA